MAPPDQKGGEAMSAHDTARYLAENYLMLSDEEVCRLLLDLIAQVFPEAGLPLSHFVGLSPPDAEVTLGAYFHQLAATVRSKRVKVAGGVVTIDESEVTFGSLYLVDNLEEIPELDILGRIDDALLHVNNRAQFKNSAQQEAGRLCDIVEKFSASAARNTPISHKMGKEGSDNDHPKTLPHRQQRAVA